MSKMTEARLSFVGNMPSFCANCGRNRMEHFLRDALAHIERLEGENVTLRAWYHAVDEESVTIGLAVAESGHAKDTLRAVIDWHCAAALDPSISARARDLLAARDAELKDVWTYLEMENANRDRLIEAIAPGEIPPPVEELVARVEGMRKEVARLTEERDSLSHLYTLSETAKNLAYTERGKADTALATLRGKIGELHLTEAK